MNYWLNRRRLILGSSAIVSGAMSYRIRCATAQSPGELRVALNGGDFEKACIEAYVKPFEAETGVKVTPVGEEIPQSTLELMVSTNSVSLDVIPVTAPMAVIAAEKRLLEEIDYSIYKKDELDAMMDFTKTPYSVGSIVYALCMAYNTEKFPVSKPRPATWEEFWNVAKYPGVRALPSGEYGDSGPWEEALLADGVSTDALYPLDIDRAFASLDRIKPHIRKWFVTGSENQQLLHDKVVDIMQTYDGRAIALVDQGEAVEVNRNQQKLTWESWGIPRGAKNLQNAQKFIEFVTRADRQAAFAQLMPYGPANRNSYKLLPENVGRKFASHPDYLESSTVLDAKWYTEAGSDGVTNVQRLVDRWNEWILQ